MELRKEKESCYREKERAESGRKGKTEGKERKGRKDNNLTVESQRKERILKATREKQLVMHKTVPIRLSAGFQPRSCSLEGSGMIKINEKYTANQEYYIQQNYPLKKRRKTFPNKK